MLSGQISRLVLVVSSAEDGTPIERWQFAVQIQAPPQRGSASTSYTSNENNVATQATPEEQKTDAQIQAEIQSIFRQITASVTFLPTLDAGCTFNVLVYADAESEVPLEWGDSDAKEIEGGEKVQLRSFSTSNHKVETLVSYRLAE